MRKTVRGFTDHVGLTEVFDSLQEVVRTGTAVDGHLLKARRAVSLGLPAELSAVYEQAAAREARHVVRQIDAALARLEDRRAQPDWQDTVAGLSRAFEERDGVARADDMRERLRLSLFEQDGLAPEAAERIQLVADDSFQSLAVAGLEGPLRQLDDALRDSRLAWENVSGDATPARLRGLSVNQSQVDCITVACGIAAAAFIVCIFTSLCSWSAAIAMLLVAAVIGCFLIY